MKVTALIQELQELVEVYPHAVVYVDDLSYNAQQGVVTLELDQACEFCEELQEKVEDLKREIEELEEENQELRDTR